MIFVSVEIQMGKKIAGNEHKQWHSSNQHYFHNI